MAIVPVIAASIAAPLPPLDIVAPPPVVTPREAADHLDEVVVLETAIASARFVDGRVVLQPAGEANEKLRIVLVPPMIGEGGRRLADRYPGHRVRVLGRVREFDGEYEIFSTDPDAIEIVDAVPPAPSAAAILPSGSEAAAPVAAAPLPAARVASGGEVTAPVAAAPLPATIAASGAATVPEPCSVARHDWATAAAAARSPLEALEHCLAAGVPACGSELAAVRSALGEVAAGEERIHWHCGR